jgi:hypothetical protein
VEVEVKMQTGDSATDGRVDDCQNISIAVSYRNSSVQ